MFDRRRASGDGIGRSADLGRRGPDFNGVLHGQNQHKIIPPSHGASRKNEQDVHLFERLVFMSRRKN